MLESSQQRCWLIASLRLFAGPGTNVSLDGRLGLSEGSGCTCGLGSYVNADNSGSANCELIVFQARDGKARETKYGMQVPISTDVPGAPNLQVVLRATRPIAPGVACRMNYRL